MEPFTRQLESMLKRNKDFSQQLKQRLFLESVNVKNPLNFVVSLFLEGVLNDQGGQQDTNVELTIGFIVQLVMMMACSKGAKGINGLMKALEASGNSEFISALRKWAKEDFDAETDGHLRSTRKGDVSATITTIKLFIDTMISRIREELMGQLACNVVNLTKDESNLVHNDSVLEETNIESVSASYRQVTPNLAHWKVHNEPKKASFVPPTTGSRIQERPETKNDPKHFDIKNESKCVPKRDDTDLEPDNSENLTKGKKSSIQMSLHGTKLINKIMSYVDNDLSEPLEGFWMSKATDIVNVPKFCSSLVHQMVLEEYDIQLVTGPKVQEGQQVEKVIKAACSKKAIGSLVIALQSSNNERILVETCEWFETLPARKKSDPVAIKSLAHQKGTCATGLFAATDRGLIYVDLRTLKTTALTSKYTLAVAVNHNLKKVYWSDGYANCSMCRSNLDGSNTEVVVPKQGGNIQGLAIEETSGNVYFALYDSHEIKVCNALGQNCAVVISNSSLVKFPNYIALDTVKGLMYWANDGQSIARANLDGNKATIISAGFKSLRGLTLDQASSDVVYWADWGENTIGTIDVNGGNKRTLVELKDRPEPWGIQVDAHKIYIGNYEGKNIQSVDRVSGKELTTILNTTGSVCDLAVSMHL